jgi:hypothetical protein
MLRSFKAELRVNSNSKLLLWKKKGESVPAEYAGKASEGGYRIDIVGIRDRSDSGAEYFRFAFTLQKGADKTYLRGRLFENTRAIEGRNHPGYTGDMEVDQATGDRLRLAAWIKFDDPKDESTAYLSLDVSEFSQKHRPAPTPTENTA